MTRVQVPFGAAPVRCPLVRPADQPGEAGAHSGERAGHADDGLASQQALR